MEANNKIIAEFMGFEIKNKINYVHSSLPNFMKKAEHLKVDKSENLPFHNDWNWLMEVVEKIESLGYWTELLGGYHQEFRIGKINQIKEFINKDSSDKKEAVYNTCLEFIKWYNENKI